MRTITWPNQKRSSLAMKRLVEKRETNYKRRILDNIEENLKCSTEHAGGRNSQRGKERKAIKMLPRSML